MGAVLSYSIASAIALSLLYLPYRLMMAGERQPSCNRAIIALIYVMALLAPFILTVIPAGLTPAATVAATVEVDLTGGLAAVTTSQTPLWMRAAVAFYGIGVVLTALYFLISIINVNRMVGRGRRQPYGKFTLVVTSDSKTAPFSWLRYIVISQKDYAEACDMILTHEYEHLRRRHFVDVLLAQAVAALQWFNPAAWMMMDELKSVHEYEADEAVLRAGADMRRYQTLLIKKAVGARVPCTANSLNQSKLKNRIAMMYKKETTTGRRLRVLALAPVFALALFALHTPAVASILEITAETVFVERSESPAPLAVEVDNTQPTVEKEELPTPEVAAEFPGGRQRCLCSLPAISAIPTRL